MGRLWCILHIHHSLLFMNTQLNILLLLRYNRGSSSLVVDDSEAEIVVVFKTLLCLPNLME